MVPEPNVSITGMEARILMAALRTSEVSAPMGSTLNLYLALNAISQVQPPPQPPTEQTLQKTSNEG